MAKKPGPKQKTIATFGEYGQTVRVCRRGELYRVQSRALGITKSYRGEGAKEKAMGFAQRLSQSGAPVVESKPTVADLWDAYITSSAFRELRPKSQLIYRDAWRLFREVVPHHTLADDVTIRTLELVRTTLEDTPRPRAESGLAINTVRKAITIVKCVFAWAERHEIIPRNRVHAFVFKVGKDRRPVTPDEYSGEEFQKLLGALSFDRISQRIPYCVLSLCGYQGVRINAVLHLRWEDVRWEDDVVVWQGEFDKQGNTWDQPLRRPTRAIIARLWEAMDRPATGWVFPSQRKGSKTETYTVQSFWWALRAAEDRAGVAHRPRRAAHGLRRMVAGDLVDATGSAQAAMEGIGDRDVKMAERYVKRRTGRTARSLNSLDREEGAA